MVLDDSEYFVKEGSIVRKIWGSSDIILFIFAASAGEFALHKSVDWLYFTGKLPGDPVGRMFSTVKYARRIVFSNRQIALKTIQSINIIHHNVESKRGYTIPDWAYRDVLSMLIDYSISAFELLRRKLTDEEKEEVYHVFYRFGSAMDIPDLPINFKEWKIMRSQHLSRHYINSNFTKDLFKQYKKQLGSFRFRILIEAQKLLLPGELSHLLGYRNTKYLSWMVPLYKLSRNIKLNRVVENLLLPSQYRDDVHAMDVAFTA